MKQILLIGNTGQVGFELASLLPSLGHLHAVDFPGIDLANPASIRAAVSQARPDIIINAAAYTAVDRAESEPDLCRAINATAPGILASEAARLGATLVHYSTDFVFDGSKRTPYTEEDTPHPLGVYGQTKLEGDLAIRASGAHHLIFRTAWVYGRRGKNFLLTLQRLAGEGKPLRVVADQIGCPTWSRSIALTTAGVLAQRDQRTLPAGLYNLVCGGSASWHAFARAFIPPDIPVTPISTADYPTPARRPAYSVLDCSRLQQTFGITLPSWQDALRQCIEDPA